MTLSTFIRRAPRAPAPLCRDRALGLVHKYAVFGTIWALLPVPMATSAGLALLETHLIYWIARIYGESPSKSDVLMTAAGLELASVALKSVAIEGAALVPVVGLGVKAGIAGSVVEALGHAIVRHYEGKHPNRATDGPSPLAH
jgi:uncharacterized protein (DUF697 family)